MPIEHSEHLFVKMDIHLQNLHASSTIWASTELDLDLGTN